MQKRTRRRIDAALLVLGALAVGGTAAAGSLFGDSERLHDLWLGAEVAEDGSARIVEVIDYDFGSRARHGIFRDVPGLSPDARVVVSSATAPDDVLVTGTAYDSRIRVGDPNRTVRGRHRYTIEYPLAAVAPSGGLSWNAVGSSWTVPIESAHIHVVAPFRLAALAGPSPLAPDS